MKIVYVANTIMTLSNNINRDKALEEVLTMTTFEFKTEDNNEIIILTPKKPPSMRYRTLKTWIGGMFVFFLGTYFLITVIPDLLG